MGRIAIVMDAREAEVGMNIPIHPLIKSCVEFVIVGE